MDAKSTQSSGLYDFLAWLDANWKKVLIGAVGIVIAVAAFALYSWNQRKTEQEANAGLLAITTRGGQGSSAVISPEEFLKIVQQHPNTAAADRAQLLAAGKAFETGDYAKAQAQFDAALKSVQENALKAQAAYGLAATLEAQKNFDQAIQKYEEVARQYSDQSVAPLSKLSLARIYETQGKPEAAQKIYLEIENKETMFQYWQNDAAQRRERLESRNPQLTKTPAANEQIFEITTPPAPAADNP